MSDKPIIFIGLVIALAVLAVPFWYTLAAGTVDLPSVDTPEGKCVEEDMTADAVGFLNSSFVEALNENPALMFDLLALVDVENRGVKGAASEKETIGSANLKSTTQNLKSLADAWLSGQWDKLPTVLADLASDEQLAEVQEA